MKSSFEKQTETHKEECRYKINFLLRYPDS